ncbi:M23 family metallopeptidase [Bacillus kexueae]|uniref:M23 family metallopeptidase n=1 Tax=Aeribacillus kexueae TaxID=2078952 RepID=UPI001FAE9496
MLWRKRKSVQTIKKKKNWKSSLLGMTFASMMLVGANSASANSEFSTIYHIYLDGQYIGAVDSEEVIQQVSEEKIAEEQENHENMPLAVEDLVIVPEQTFRPAANNESTASKLKQELQVVVTSTSIVIDGQSIAHFASKEDAEKALTLYKQKYVSEEALTQLESQKESEEPLPDIQKGESRIIDVSLSKEVSYSEEKISPEDVLSIEEGVKLLQNGTLVEKTYTVKEKDVLVDIAKNHNMKLDELLALNPEMDEETIIRPGDELKVQGPEPFFTVKVQEEVLKEEKIAYETEVVEDSSLPKGETRVKQEGKEGTKLLHTVVYKENGQQVKVETKSEEVITEPTPKIVVKGTKVIPSRGTGSLAWPAVGGYVSSKMGTRWGRMHKGIDIARPSNYTIKAADNGTVVSAGYDGGYGNKVVINHNNGMKTVYAHLDSISVKVGQTVSRGQKIGVMGSTGNSTGVHLHFEVYVNGSLRNPLDYF